MGFPGYLTGTTEPDEQQALRKLLGSGDTFWNVGANIGFHALLGARFVGNEGVVVAFEPDSVIASAARKNADLNQFSNIHVINKAVTDRTGVVILYMGEHSAVNTLHKDRATGEGISVEAVSLDDFLLYNGRPPDLISIDVEGAEIGVLLGALDIIRKHRPKLLLELHWVQSEFYKFFDEDLAPIGYRLVGLDFEPYTRKLAAIREHVVALVD